MRVESGVGTSPADGAGTWYQSARVMIVASLSTSYLLMINTVLFRRREQEHSQTEMGIIGVINDHGAAKAIAVLRS
jgi:hypothetical protein